MFSSFPTAAVSLFHSLNAGRLGKTEAFHVLGDSGVPMRGLCGGGDNMRRT